MRVPIAVPDLGESSNPLRLGEWTIELGDAVMAGESLAELICPGLALDLAAPGTGVVIELCKQPDQSLAAGEIIGWLETPDAASDRSNH